MFVFSQFFNSIPVDFDQVKVAQTLRNPAFFGDTTDYNSTFGYKGFNSLSENLRTFYGDISYKKQKQGFGMQFFQDQEGLFLYHSRFYARYGYQLEIKKNYFLRLGLGAGFVNFKVKDNLASHGFSDQKFDLQGGIHLYNSSFGFQFSSLQLLDNQLSLARSTVELQRYYQFFANKKFARNPIWAIEPQVFARLSASYQPDLRLGTELEYKKMAYFSTHYQWASAWIVLLGLRNIEWENLYLGTAISYRNWIASANRTNANQIEICLQIGLNKSKGLLLSSEMVEDKE
jgi:hypothetical protein